MILNTHSAQLIKQNAERLAMCVTSKEDLADLATASNFEQIFSAIETLLTHTDMYFDDELLAQLNEDSWRGFKATLLVYSLNLINRFQHEGRQGGALTGMGASSGTRDLVGASANL